MLLGINSSGTSNISRWQWKSKVIWQWKWQNVSMCIIRYIMRWCGSGIFQPPTYFKMIISSIVLRNDSQQTYSYIRSQLPFSNIFKYCDIFSSGLRAYNHRFSNALHRNSSSACLGYGTFHCLRLFQGCFPQLSSSPPQCPSESCNDKGCGGGNKGIMDFNPFAYRNGSIFKDNEERDQFIQCTIFLLWAIFLLWYVWKTRL